MPSNSSKSDTYAFWSKVVLGNNGCLEWIGAHSSTGYGSIGRKGKVYRAHRFSYQMLVGDIPDGKVLDHICRNKNCVAPDHLEIVTQLINTHRGTPFAARNAKVKNCPKGHSYSKENTTINKKGSRVCIECKRSRSREYMKKIRRKI